MSKSMIFLDIFCII